MWGQPPLRQAQGRPSAVLSSEARRPARRDWQIKTGEPRPAKMLRALLLAHEPVIDPQQTSRPDAHPSHRPPHLCRLVSYLAEVMHEGPAKPSANQRADSYRQKCEAHVRAL